MINFVLNYINIIFYKILYMSIIGIFVGAFILLVRKILDKKISPKWKCIIWILLMVELVVPIKITIPYKYKNTEIMSISGLAKPIQNISSYNQTTNHEEIAVEKAENNTDSIIQNNTEDKKQEENKNICVNLILPLLWTAGILLNLVFIILGELNIKKNIKGKKYIDKNLKNLLEECKAKLHIKNNVEIMLQEFKKTPSIIGVFKPKILITQEFLDQDEKTKKYIIMHELSHYKRKDSLFNYVLLIITVIHWFNPFVWIFFKKIRQDIELATDEMVLEKLQKNEKKEYGMTLINSLQIFQEEPYTAKLLCVTDDNKNMERRIKMVKLSDKFSKNKILICVISLIVIVLGILLFFTQSNQYNSTKTNDETIQKDETPKYEFRTFKPSFKSTSDSDYDDYDFTQDMTYMDKIYYKKINTYNEYEKEKAMWKDIIDMTESDFKDNFMVITAIENTSMVGLTVDKLETDNNNLYISLIHYPDGVEYDENQTCISYKISRELERDNIYAVRNLRDTEKDMSDELKLIPNTYGNFFTYSYKTKEYRENEKKQQNNPNSNLRLAQVDWQDYDGRNFGIAKNTPEIDFSKWNDLGNGFYSIAITDYSDYLKMINNYNAPQIKWYEFEYIYAIIIVRTNTDNTILVDGIEEEDGKSYLNVRTGGWLDVTEEFKYPAMCVAVPNYRSLENSFLNVRVK